MKSVLRATAVLSGSSAARVGIGVVTAKAWAILVGPVGLGTLGLLQSAVGLGGILAGLGVGTGVVRMGAHALGQRDAAGALALHRATLGIAWAAGLVALAVFVALRAPLSRWLFGSAEYAGTMGWMGVAVCFAVVSAAQTGVLNAHHRVSALARSAVVGGLLGSAVSVGLIWWLQAEGIVWAVVALSGALWATTQWYLGREVRYPDAPRVSGAALARAARRLLGFGVPYVGSALVGAGVMLALPLLVARALDVESVGYYRAAVTISVGYLGFLLTAMAQDYYPRLSAASSDAAEVERLVNQQLRLTLLIGGPVVVLALVTAPFVVPLIYSAAFAPTVPVLAWQLIGSLFKFWAWTFSFVILARSSSAQYFGIEAVGGGALFVGTWVGMAVMGLVGTGVGFLGAYFVYAAVVWIMAQRDGRIRISIGNRVLGLVSLGTSLVAYARLGGEGPFISLVIALMYCGVCGWTLHRDYHQSNHII